jgi:hypothetical protein
MATLQRVAIGFSVAAGVGVTLGVLGALIFGRLGFLLNTVLRRVARQMLRGRTS